MMLNCNSCSKLIPDDSEFCPFCGNKIIKKAITLSENSEHLHLYQPEALLKRAFLLLEEGLFDKADAYLEAVLNQDPENAEAYVGKLLIDFNASSMDELLTIDKTFGNNINYKRALRYGDESLKEKLLIANRAVAVAIANRKEAERIRQEAEQTKKLFAENEKIYQAAKLLLIDSKGLYYEKANKNLKDAIALLKKIPNHKNALALCGECEQAIEYNIACSKMGCGEIASLEEAIEEFENLAEYKDSKDRIEECKKEIEDINRKSKRNQKIVKIATTIICVVIACAVIFSVIVNTHYYYKYNKATALLNEGKFLEAYEIFDELNDYKDSIQKANSIYISHVIKKAKIGDCIKFGEYEQDNNKINGKEDIEWIVIDIKNDKLLVISKYALDCQQYSEMLTYATWETCPLRQWLNNDFINSAFTFFEGSLISFATVTADKNPDYDTNPGSDTFDKIFLLSITEANKYFSSDEARQCKATKYAKKQGVYVSDSTGSCNWWLRSPGSVENRPSLVLNDGDIRESGYGSVYLNQVFHESTAVRPAMWIDISTIK